MRIFGHLGMGSKLAAPFARRLPYGWLLLGTLIPDLIDKPLYYGLHLMTGLSGDALGLISCTRTFGHSGLLLMLVLAIAMLKRSKILAAIGLGMATHLVLDGMQDRWNLLHGSPGASATLLAATFPYFGKFAAMPFNNVEDHLRTGTQPFILMSEVLGFLILVWDYYRRRIIGIRSRPLRNKRSGE